MTLFLEQLVNGISLGSLYALFGIGFGLVFATLGVLNVAHGAYASWAAILGYFSVEYFGVPFPVAVGIGVFGGGIIAIAVDQIGFQPLRGRKTGMLGALITSIAFLIILDSLAGMVTNHQSWAFPSSSYPSGMVDLGIIRVPEMQIIIIVSTLICGVGIYALIQKTRIGAAMRAVGWSDEAAALSGVNPRMVILLTAFLAGATSGLAGVLGGAATSNISHMLGEGLLLKGFAAVVVGGFDDVRGTVIAGILLGICEVFVAQYLSTTYRDGFTYVLLLTFLVARPRGLFGSRDFMRA
ncbi:MAG: branched-chain amino acid ABC transporter permease [Hoeflea sp.]|uniref:branched-chain amino acid ABC transporter permease n=1 Tax=Hoeflea sp. TaxID=1940281 RepID=UPI00272FFB6D|nr:branched-chain amino acid ABC transporter permease [Hoeflea sp.]MDP2119285.1 branched-chain amino acid ABC transporter permease [Hoeflea sp.]MDP3524846.1 branched-chain amino acid ABC transporter permease [Hoeflea sp.]